MKMEEILTKLKNNTIRVLIIAVLLTVAFVILCLSIENRRLKNKVAETAVDVLLSDKKIDSFKNSIGDIVYQKELAVTESNNKIKTLSDELFLLKRANDRLIKKVNSYTKVEQQIVIDSVYIPYSDTIYITKNDEEYIKVPKYFHKYDKDYLIAGTLNKTGLIVDSLRLNNTLAFRQVEIRKNIFSKTETVVQVINTNPYIHTTGVQSITIKNKKSEWDKWIKPTLAAIGAGILVYELKK